MYLIFREKESVVDGPLDGPAPPFGVPLDGLWGLHCLHARDAPDARVAFEPHPNEPLSNPPLIVQ